jgi:hypothetical protein
MPFQPNEELIIRMTVIEWNQIIAQLNEGPYKIVSPLINKINVQAASQEQGNSYGQAFTVGDHPHQPVTPRGDVN